MRLASWLDGFHRRWVSPWGQRRLSHQGTRQRRRFGTQRPGMSPVIEALESRVYLAQAVPFDGTTFVVPGTPSEISLWHFEFTSRDAFNLNELGLYIADNAQGTVSGQRPGDAGFTAAVLNSPRRHKLFTGNEAPGTSRDLPFHGGDIVSFYMVQNGSTQSALLFNPQNQLARNPHVWFANPSANPDRFDHLNSSAPTGDSVRLMWEDQTGGGDRDFNDAVVTFSPTQTGVYLVPGTPDQLVPVKFTATSKDALYNSEVGLIIVDNDLGQIGTRLPGQPGWAASAFGSERWKSIFPPRPTIGAEVTLNLPGGTRFLFFGVQNGTVADHIARNLDNQIFRQSPAFFGVSSANPDNATSHIRVAPGREQRFEDGTFGGDRDYNDLVFRFEFGTPPVTESPVVTAGLLTDSGTSATDRLTNDPTIRGTVTGTNPIVVLEAAVDTGSGAPVYRDISSSLSSGQFTLSRNQLAALLGGPLVDGVYRVSVRARNAGGRESNVATVNFTLDTQADAPLVALLNDTGVSSTDLVTNDATHTGTATDPNGIVKLEAALDTGTGLPAYQDITGKLTGSQYTLTAGDLAILLGSDLTDGSYRASLRTTDTAGNVSTVTTFLFTLDSQAVAPQVGLQSDTGTSDADRLTANPTLAGTAADPTLEGEEPDPTTVVLLEGALDTGTGEPVFHDITSKLVNGRYTLTTADLEALFGAPLVDGPYRFSTRKTDRVGNVSPVTEVLFTLDTQIDTPVLTLASDTGSSSTDQVTSDASLAVDASDPGGIALLQVAIDDGTGTPVWHDVTSRLASDHLVLDAADLALILGGSVADGPYRFSVQATDRAGNLSGVGELLFTLDTSVTTPLFDLEPTSDTAPVGDQQTELDTVTLIGTTDPFATVTLDPVGFSTTADELGAFLFSNVPLEIGTNDFSVTATDAAGNNASSTQSIVRLSVHVDDCGFENGFGDWTAAQWGGSDPDTGFSTIEPGPAGDDQATLFEGNSFLVTLRRTFTIPDTPSVLTIEYSDLSFDTTDPNFVNDAFEMALVDSHGSSLVHSFTAGADSFFNITENLPAETGAEATLSNTTATSGTISLDVSGLSAGTAATLVLRLVNNDSDSATNVTVACVKLTSQNAVAGLAGTYSEAQMIVIDVGTNDSATNSEQTSPFLTELYPTALETSSVAPTIISAPTHARLFVTTNYPNAANADTLYRYDVKPGGEFTLETSRSDSSFNSLYSLAISPTGHLFATSRGIPDAARVTGFIDIDHNLQRDQVASSSDLRTLFGSAFNRNELFVTRQNGNDILRFLLQPDGSLRPNGSIKANHSPVTLDRGMTFSPWGEMFVTQIVSNTIARYQFDADGNAIPNGLIVGNGLNSPHDLEFSPWGELFVSNTGAGSISRFRFDEQHQAMGNGQILTSETGIVAPNGMAFSPWAELYVGQHEPNGLACIGRWTFDGSFIATFADSFIPPARISDLEFYWPAPPTLVVRTPSHALALSVGDTVLISGSGNRPVFVNGLPVDVYDSAGNFFEQVTISPGNNVYTFTTSDDYGQSASATLTLTGSQPTPGQIDFSQFTDVTGSLGELFTRTSFNEKTNTLHTDAAVRNDGQYLADAPLLVAVDQVTEPLVRVRDHVGVTPSGLPYYDYTSSVPTGTLPPGVTTGTQTVSFYAPQRDQFHFDLILLGRVNEAPAFTSLPDIEALAGRSYTYAAGASDPNGDPLTYSKIAGPDSLVVDPQTGQVTWTPAANDAGTQSITLQVADGRGGFGQQHFLLSVITAPANRPPVITSVPVVEGRVNTPYLYKVTATDADSDNLTWSLTAGPTGMEIDPIEGTVLWTPMSRDIGQGVVNVTVTDGHGGMAEQQFAIAVQAEIGNHAPVITTDPTESILLQGAQPLFLKAGFRSTVISTLSATSVISGLANGDDGKLYISTISGGTIGNAATIYELDLSSNAIATLTGTGLSNPGNMVVSKDGPFGSVLLATDWNAPGINGSVLRIDSSSGAATTLFVGALNRPAGDPFGVALGRGGSFGDDLYLMDFQGNSASPPLLQKITASGHATVFAESSLWTTESVPASIEFSDPSGPYGDFLYVADVESQKIWRVSSGGAVSEFAVDQSIRPVALRFGVGGAFGTDLYVLDVNGRIFQVSPSGTTSLFSNGVTVKGNRNPSLADFGFSSDGMHMFVAGGNQVFEITAYSTPTYRYDVDALDPDDDLLDYTLEQAPPGMQIDATTGQITWNVPGPQPQDSFTHRIGDSQRDEGRAVAVDGDGNVYATGFYVGTVDFDPGPGVTSLTSSTGSVYVASYTRDGALRWARSTTPIGAVGGDFSLVSVVDAAALDADGNLYLAGAFKGSVDFDSNPATPNTTSAGDFDAFVWKLDPLGNTIWVRQFGGTQRDQALDLRVDSAGNIHFAGLFNGTADFDPGPGSLALTSAGGADAFIAQIDAQGTLVRAQRLGGAGPDEADSLAISGTGQIAVGGQFSGTVDFDPGAGTFTRTSAGNNDGFVVLLSATGEFSWAHTIGGSEYEGVRGVDFDPSGNLLATGLFQGTVDFDPGAGQSLHASAGSYDIFLVRLATSGEFDWVKQIGSTGDDEPRTGGLTVDPAGNIFLTGNFQNTVDLDPGTSVFSVTGPNGSQTTHPHHGFLLKLDASAQFLWATAGKNLAGRVAVSCDGDIYQTGAVSDSPASDTQPGTFDLYIRRFTQPAPCPEVIVRVDDGRGGSDKQRFTINFLPNRSPVIVSPPVTDAFIGHAYSYNVDAVDPDSDPLTYSLVEFPAGMSINAQTGEISWPEPTGVPALLFGGSAGSTFDDRARGVAADHHGNVFMVGVFSGPTDFDFGPDTHVLMPLNPGDFNTFVAKYSRSGELLWVRQAGGAEAVVFANSIAVDREGNSYALGRFSGLADFDPSVTTHNIESNSVGSWFIWKLDNDGRLVNVNTLHGSGSPGTIVVDDAGGTYSIGRFSGTVDFDPGSGVETLDGGSGATFLWKLDASGAYAFARAIVGAGIDNRNLAVGRDGMIHISGEFYDTVDFDPGPGQHLLVSQGRNDAFVVQLDPLGNLNWARSFGGTSFDQGRGIAVDSRGNVYSSGEFQRTVVFDATTQTTLTETASSSAEDAIYDAYFVKLGPDGSFQWVRQFGSSGNEDATNIEVDELGNVYTSGLFTGTARIQGSSQAFSLTRQLNSRYLLKFDPDGNLDWGNDVGGMWHTVSCLGDIVIASYFQGTIDIDPSSSQRLVTSNGADFDIVLAAYSQAGALVRVDDGRGGYDTQCFTLDVHTSSPSTLHGVVYDDLNGDGQQNGDEPGLGGWIVFFDTNGDGVRQANEQATTTSAAGVYTFAGIAAGSYSVALEGQTGWNQTSPAAGPHSVTVNPGQNLGPLEFGSQCTTASDNRSPAIASSPVVTATPGQLFRYNAFATDPDNDPLTFDLPVKPAGMAIDPQRGIVVWVPTSDQIGPQDVMLRVSDGRGGVDLQSFTMTVSRANSTPVITSTPTGPAVVSQPWQYQVTAQDADVDGLAYSLGAHPLGMTIDAVTGLVKFTAAANQVGSPHVEVTASDGRGASTTQSFDLPVALTAPNDSPQISSTPRTRIRLGDRYLYELVASDPNGDPLTFALTSAPAGMTINAAGLVTWIPTDRQFGENSVELKVDDGRGSAVFQSWKINVVSQTTNTPPTITSNPPGAATVGRPYAYDVKGTDVEGDPLAFSLDAAPAGMSIDSTRGTLRWTPAADETGSQQVIVRVVDGQGGSATQTWTVTVRPVNVPPNITSTPLTSGVANSLYSYAVAASDPENDPLTFTLVTKPVGMTIDSGTGLVSWTPTAAQLGSSTVSVTVNDGQGGSATQSWSIVVAATGNHAPVITSSPTQVVTAGSLYTYQVAASDADGEALLFSLLAGPDNMAIDPLSGLVTWTPAANQLGSQTVTVAAVDPHGAGGTQTFSLVVVDNNQAPTITSSPANTITAGLTYRYDVRASDPDGDPLSYRLDQAPTGVTLDALGRLTWNTSAASVGTHRIALTVADNRGASITQTFDLAVGADGQTPRVNLLVSADPAPLGRPVTFVVTATDNVRVQTLGLTINGNPVPLDPNGRITLLAQPAGIYELVASATDPSGNTGLASRQLLVTDPSDVNAPTVEVTAPADGAQITAPVDVVGTVTDTNLAFYTISAAPPGSRDNEFRELFRGTQPVVNGTLGRFDPTGLANGSYVLRVLATDLGGNTSYVDTAVEVAGDLKIGNFSLSFTDLSIPVVGVPITVSRTYDSLTAGQTDELGYGWRLEFRDTDLRTSVPATNEEEYGIYNPFRHGTRVYVTLPGGRREGFTFEPKVVTAFNIGLGIYEPYFRPDAGVTSSLAVPRVTLFRNDSGEYFNGLPYNPADPNFATQYFLTTKEGLAYTINSQTGELDRVEDPSGNVLTFSDTAVTSNRGPAITFERDPHGRITAAVDPLGGRVRYQYDARGDLVAVTDREGIVTQFVYGNPQHPHFLTQIIDPLGRDGVRTEYDAQGRLVKLIDASGQQVSLTHDPDNFVETVIDAFNNPTTFEYDIRGNVVREINALGQQTVRTYNDNNDLLTETNHLGQKTTYTYDGDSNLLTETDALGNVTQYTYISIQPGPWARLAGARPVPLQTSITDPLGNTTTNEYSGTNLVKTTDGLGNVTKFTYDGEGNQTSITDAAGKTVFFEYDSAGRLKKQTDAIGSVTTYTYDGNGNQLSQSTTVTGPAGPRTVQTTSQYDASGRVIAVTDAEGNTTHTEYNALRQQSATIDALGRQTHFVYDTRGQLVETIFPDSTPGDLSDNPRSTTTYDAAGRAMARTDETGARTEFVYDALGRLIETILPDATPSTTTDNPRTKTVYDAAGRVAAQIDELGRHTEFEYDAAGRQTLVRDALGNVSTTTYDAAGRVISTTDALGHTTRFTLDALGRQTRTTFADGTTRSSAYDVLGRVVGETDALGRTTQYEYDALGRLTAVVDGLNQRTTYGYDEAGNLITQTDAAGHVTRYEYDLLGRKVATVLPMGQRSTMQYNAVGIVASTTDFNGDTITFTYDDRNRLLAKNFPDGTQVTFTYSPNGQRQTEIDARGTTTFEYDDRDRLQSRTDPDGTTISYTYDAAGNRTSVTTHVPGSTPLTTTYTFDALNRQSTVTDPDGDVIRYTYNALGALVQTEFHNGVIETRTYDALHRLTSLVNRNSAGVVLTSYDYVLAPTGRRDRVTEANGRRVDYTYDALDRLTGETIVDPVNGNRTITYTYDAVGNRLTRVDSAEGTTASTYDANDRLLTETLGSVVTTYTYSASGDTLTKGVSSGANAGTTRYVWDYEHRLVAVDSDNNGTIDVANCYNAEGLRVSQVLNPGQPTAAETRYLLDTVQPYGQVSVEYTPGGVILVSYVHGLDLISQNRFALGAGAKSYYLVDGLGSTRALTGQSGLMTDGYTYEAFGRLIAQSGSTENVYLFAGEQRDVHVGLDYLRARYLNVGSGRFFGRDPFNGVLKNPVTLHPFTYAANNPANAIDPSGRFSLIEVTAVAAILGYVGIKGFQIYTAGINPFRCPQFRSALASNFADEFIAINEEIPGVIALPGLGFLTGAAVANTIGEITIVRAALIAALNPVIPYFIPFGSTTNLRVLAGSALRTVAVNFIVVSVGFEAGIAFVALDRAIDSAIDTTIANDTCS